MKRADQWILIDNYKRKYFLKFEIQKKLLKSLTKNSKLKLIQNYIAFLKQIKIKKNKSVIMHNNRCVRTGRTWSINRFTQYSRFYLRTEIYKGNIPGFKRSSW